MEKRDQTFDAIANQVKKAIDNILEQQEIGADVDFRHQRPK